MSTYTNTTSNGKGACRRTRLYVSVAALWMAAAMPTAAQSAGCAAVRADTLGGMIYGNIDLDGPITGLGRGLSREFLDRVLKNIGAGIRDTVFLSPMYSASEDILVPAIKAATTKDLRPPIAPAWTGHSALATEVAFVMRRGGELTDVRVRNSADSAIAATLVRALAEAGAREGRPTIPADVPADAIRFMIRLSLNDDRAAAATQPLIPARQIVPEAQPPHAQSKNDPPKYPEGQRMRGMSAVVVAWFDVDERGRVVKGTFGAASPVDPDDADTYRAFASSVERASGAWRFAPATAGGCAIRARTATVVRFVLQ